MQDIKALIKVEQKPAILISLYFLLIYIGTLLLAGGILNQEFENYLRYGNVPTDINGEVFLPLLSGVALFIFFGILILIFFQFKYDKSIEVGRFLRALPYTNSQRYLVKVLSGICSITVPFIVFGIGLLILRNYALAQFKDAYSVINYSQILYIINSSNHLIVAIVLSYLVYVAVYLFCFMIQYLMNNNIGGLVSSIFILASPAFIIESANGIFGLSYYGRVNMEKLFLPIYPVISYWHEIVFEEGNKTQSIGYQYIRQIEDKMIIAGVVSVLCLIITYYISKTNKIEDSDILIPDRGSRWIFIVGVSLCASFLLGDISELILSRVFMGHSHFITQIMLVVGAVIGFIISKKIAYIGVVAKKRFHLKKIIPMLVLPMLLMGCANNEEDITTYQISSYDEAYYIQQEDHLNDLQYQIEKLGLSHLPNWNFGRYREYQLNVEFYKDFDTSNPIIDVIETFTGANVNAMINTLKEGTGEILSKEISVGDYVIVCSKIYDDIIINITQKSVQLTDSASQRMLEKIITPDFVLQEMEVGEQANMMKIATPSAMSYSRQASLTSDVASYYQIFRNNNEAITKIRYVIYTGQNLGDQIVDKKIDSKQLIPLHNIIDYLSGQETPIDMLIADINSVYQNDKMKALGQINDIHYYIKQYGSEYSYSGKLIEVVLEVNE